VTVTATSLATFDAWFAGARAELSADLCDLVALPTLTPAEEIAFPWLGDRLGAIGCTVTLEPRHPSLAGHPDANRNPWLALEASTRGALHAELAGGPATPRVLFSAHIDVVPGGRHYPDAFNPVVRSGAVHGRGTADTKGNIVMLMGALSFLREQGIVPTRHVAIDFVNEEEVGGNGALSTLLHGREAEEVVVLEPTSLEVFHGHRGCLEFSLHVRGRSTHMGCDRGWSAIDGAVQFIDALRLVEADLIVEAASDPDFGSWPRPLQINVGAIHGGEWHGSTPEDCVVSGAFGFLPQTSPRDVQRLLEGARAAIADPVSAGASEFVFGGIHNDAYRGRSHGPVARRLRQAALRVGIPPRPPRAWNVSCDARLYHHVGGLPTVIWGCGDLGAAHSNHELLAIDELRLGIATLVEFLTEGTEA
jgi:acetylornithine deacetylase